jgi:dephospho-CoA kinase
MKLIGLTGGIGMGKSTAAAAFRRARLPVFDADAAVRRLQAPGGAALPAIARAFPGVVGEGGLDRAALRALVLSDPAALRRLEAIVHPLVRAAEQRFVAAARAARAPAVILDVPLLFESAGAQGGPRDRRLDVVMVVSAPPAVQMARVRRRRQMSEAQIAAVIARQMPDREKRRRADVVVRTGLSRHHALRTLRRLILQLRPRQVIHRGVPRAGAPGAHAPGAHVPKPHVSNPHVSRTQVSWADVPQAAKRPAGGRSGAPPPASWIATRMPR